jgi:hypothetical protein
VPDELEYVGVFHGIPTSTINPHETEAQGIEQSPALFHGILTFEQAWAYKIFVETRPRRPWVRQRWYVAEPAMYKALNP